MAASSRSLKLGETTAKTAAGETRDDPLSRSSAQNRHPRSLRYQCFFLPFPS